MLPAHRRILVCISLLFLPHAASQQLVKVDDANVYSPTNPNGIQFSSKGWNTVSQETTEVHYNGSYTSSQTAGANMIFFFRGTAIAYYADSVTNFGPAAVVIDGQSDTNLTSTIPGLGQYQQQIWNVTGLSQGDHQLVFSNAGRGSSPTNALGVDYFEVTPGVGENINPMWSGPGASEIPPGTVLVDDSSDMITYSGASWEAYKSGMIMGVFLGGTQSSSNTSGAAITFKFNGTGVWYFSDQQANNAIVSISVDGGVSDIVNTASTNGDWLSQMLTWGKTGLTDGPHTVTITHIDESGTYINVDFFKYMPSTTLATSASAARSNSVPVGAIVGGVVGSVALMALIVGILICRWRGQPTQEVTASEHDTYVGGAEDEGKQSYHGTPETPGLLPTAPYMKPGI
ncbi:hypothetical protein BDV93DRAFT_521394 [Ceratobasidium sp. AG-I]|nr:hypothetical protein BDV93DRAFT_521394 [Ceratobasidium sp. AG-I]